MLTASAQPERCGTSSRSSFTESTKRRWWPVPATSASVATSAIAPTVKSSGNEAESGTATAAPYDVARGERAEAGSVTVARSPIATPALSTPKNVWRAEKAPPPKPPGFVSPLTGPVVSPSPDHASSVAASVQRFGRPSAKPMPPRSTLRDRMVSSWAEEAEISISETWRRPSGIVNGLSVAWVNHVASSRAAASPPAAGPRGRDQARPAVRPDGARREQEP